MYRTTQPLEPRDAAELRQGDDESTLDDVGPDFVEEFDRRRGGPPGRDQIVDQQNARPGLDCTDVDLDTVAPVFEIEATSDRPARQLAGLSKRNEAAPEAVGDGGAEDEATSLDPATTSISEARCRSAIPSTAS